MVTFCEAYIFYFGASFNGFRRSFYRKVFYSNYRVAILKFIPVCIKYFYSICFRFFIHIPFIATFRTSINFTP